MFTDISIDSWGERERERELRTVLSEGKLYMQTSPLQRRDEPGCRRTEEKLQQ